MTNPTKTALDAAGYVPPVAGVEATWKDAAKEICADVEKHLDPVIDRLTEEIHDRVLGSVQRYLYDNAEWNIGRSIAGAERNALTSRCRADEAERERDALLASRASERAVMEQMAAALEETLVIADRNEGGAYIDRARDALSAYQALGKGEA